MKLQNCHGNPSVRLSVKMATKFQNVVNKDVRAQKDALENLNTQEHQEGFEQVFCRKSLKNSEFYKPNLRFDKEDCSICCRGVALLFGFWP